MPAIKRPKTRLPNPTEDELDGAQRKLLAAIQSGPRGKVNLSGPFAIWMQAPEFGQYAQALGGYVRLKTSIDPRLSEFAILCTARQWRAQYEWVAHAPIAERNGVSPEAIKSIRAGRRPLKAKRDELLIYDMVRELYRDRRVSDPLFKRAQKHFGNQGVVELLGILGYYSMVSMMLNVFRSEVPADKELPFKE
ncbi:MAG: carboxymuconolactone decarboxylase family protein [Rhizobiales bacterium]|nr:carboxymuconolactone decarboxylase family protein [Hyphomicrobiales bacterium]